MNEGIEGVPIQVCGYVCDSKFSESPCAIQIEDSKFIKAMAPESSSSPAISAELDYVFQHSSESEILDRSMGSLVNAYVEGVHSCLISSGSSSTNRTEFTHGNSSTNTVGLIETILELLFELLTEKTHAQKSMGYSFMMKISYFEVYEESIQDLLLSQNQKQLSVEKSESEGVYIKNLSTLGPIQSLNEAVDILYNGRDGKNSSVNAYGPVSNFTSSIFKIDLEQVFGSGNSKSRLVSVFQVIDLQSTERLSRSITSVRLNEGPLLNKTIHAFETICCALSGFRNQPKIFPYGDSIITEFLREALGGNCITLAIVFVSDNDYEGSTATLELAKKIKKIINFPVVNNEMIQGLIKKNNAENFYLRDAIDSIKSESTFHDEPISEKLSEKVHELEGRLIQENLEKLRLKDDKNKLLKTIADFRLKYQELVETEVSLREKLINSEQDKLQVSKGLLDLQLENNQLNEKVEQEKFEITTKLLNAENDILELQMREENKSQRVKELEQKMEADQEEKKNLSMEFISLKTNYVNLNQAYQNELSKNQQVGMELLTLANQKKILEKEANDLRNFKVSMEEKLAETLDCKEKQSIDQLNLQKNLKNQQEMNESLRAEKMKVELELQALLVKFESNKLEIDKNSYSVSQERDNEMVNFRNKMELEVKRLQSDRDAQMELVAKYELANRDKQRQISDLQCSVSSLTEANKDLLTSNSLSAEKLKTQEKEFRFKLLQFLNLASSVPSNSESCEESYEKPVVSATDINSIDEAIASDNGREIIIQEIIESYKSKENELFRENDRYRKEIYTLTRKQRMLMEKYREACRMLQDLATSEIDIPNIDDELKVIANTEVEEEREKELIELRERCKNLDREVSLQQEKNLQSAEAYKIIVSQLEGKNIMHSNQELKLINERDKLQNDLDRLLQAQKRPIEETSALKSMKEMQKALLDQIQEIKKATINHPTNVNTFPHGGNQTADLEDAERRCAILTTKNVMLEKELETFKIHMKKHTTSLQQRISTLESQLR